MKYNKRGITALAIVLSILIVDQAIKIWVKTHMSLYEMYSITSWFKIYFVENNGMAFGIELIGKLFLSIFRIIAVGFGAYYLWGLVKKEVKTGYIICVSMILAGAIGNILDSVFYGVFFNESYQGFVSSFVSMGQGYAGWLHGKVVDMFYFPIIKNSAGETVFFSPIFNFADSAISVGIAILLIFYRKTLSETLHSEKD